MDIEVAATQITVTFIDGRVVDYMTFTEAGKKWGVKRCTLDTWKRRGKLTGLIKIGSTYFIPSDSEKPKPKSIGRPRKRV